MLKSDVDLVDGWLAADAGEPFDNTRSALWQEGYRLWESRQSCRRAWAGVPSMSVAVH